MKTIILCCLLLSYSICANAKCDIDYILDYDPSGYGIYIEASTDAWSSMPYIDFGDGTSVSMASYQGYYHQYQSAGNYQLQLHSCQSYWVDIHINPISLPNSCDNAISFAIAPLLASNQIQLAVNNPDPNRDYHWYVLPTDTNNIKNQNIHLNGTSIPVIVYYPDTYHVCLYSRDDAGEQEICCQDINIDFVPSFQTSFNYTQSANNDYITFQNTTYALHNCNVTWDFGDGQSTTNAGNYVTHQYETAGTYVVCLTASNTILGATDTMCQLIIIDCPNDFEITYSTTYKNLVNVKYYPSGLKNGEAYWIWGDGITQLHNNNIATHAYNYTDDMNEICLFFADNTGCIDTICQSLNFNGVPTYCQAYFTPIPLFDGSAFFYKNESASLHPITQYSWNGNTHQKHFVVSSNDNEGQNVELYFTTTDNCLANTRQQIPSNTYSSDMPLRVGACFAIDAQSEVTCQFKNYSIFNPNTYLWNFGDGSSLDTTANPTHIYANNGLYRVCLTAQKNLNAETATDTFCDWVNVGNIDTCQAMFHIYQQRTNTPNSHDYGICFYDASYSNYSPWENQYYWEFGDGNYSTERHPRHCYAQKGNYSVCLTTTSPDACSSQYCQNLAWGCDINIDATYSASNQLMVNAHADCYSDISNHFWRLYNDSYYSNV